MSDPKIYEVRPIRALQYTEGGEEELLGNLRIANVYMERSVVVDLNRNGKGETRRVSEGDWILFREFDGTFYPFDVLDQWTFEERYREVPGE